MSKWISVNERFPEPKLPVLVYGRSCFSPNEKVICCATYGSPDWFGDDWFAYGCDGHEWGNIFEDVTHWMPLPDPPEDE